MARTSPSAATLAALCLLAVVPGSRLAAQDPPANPAQLAQDNAKLRAEADFARRRMALLEEEIERLRKAVQERQTADALANDQSRRTQIEHEVESLRGLEYLHPVEFREIDRKDLPAILRQKLAQQLPDQEFDNEAIAFRALGILPAGFDLKGTYLALLGEQIGAFYDQHEASLYTFTGHPLEAMSNRVILAHELTHALEDQHFSLARLPIEARGNDDRALAATALVEGDATLVMNRYMTRDVSAAALREALGNALTTDVRRLASAPRFLREMLLFPYLRGQEFCQRLYQEGNWPALNEAFAKPPTSTAQILHPELYLANPREEPVEIEFADTQIDGQKPVEDNVLGEFGLRQLFLIYDNVRASAERAAAGWRGDRYLVYSQGDAVSYFWKITCRDRAAAELLYMAICHYNFARYPNVNGSKSGPYHEDPSPDGSPKANLTAKARPLLARTTFAQGKRQVRIALTSKNEVVVIDAADGHWDDLLCVRFATFFTF